MFPALYVLWSDARNTYGLNVHYLPQIFSRKWKYKRLNWQQTQILLRKYRKHPALNRFFNFLEQPQLNRVGWKRIYPIIKKRWPLYTKIMFRHYKTPYIRLIEDVPKLTLNDFLNEDK